MEYKIQLDQFEGPLDVLLRLIEEQKLDITQLSLAKVTDQYVTYIEQQEVSAQHLADFLSVAAKLLLIKSKALLPILEFTEEEEEDIEDLEGRLREYKRFKEASKRLGEMLLEKSCQSYARQAYAGVEKLFPQKPVVTEVSSKDIQAWFLRVLESVPSVEKLKERIIQQTVSIEEKISQMKRFILTRIESTFSEMTASKSQRIHVVVSFLALLELTRQRVIHVRQDTAFGEIHIKRDV